MIRVGIDVVDVERLERSLQQWPKLADRLFTEDEQAYAESRKRPAEHLAARIAAKEATFKALGTGWPKIAWRHVEIRHDEGRPVLSLSGHAAELAGSREVDVSLSHDGGVAVASVVIQSLGEGGGK